MRTPTVATEGPSLQTAVKYETPASARPPKWPLWQYSSPPLTVGSPEGTRQGAPGTWTSLQSQPGPGVVRFDPKVVSVGTDTELDMGVAQGQRDQTAPHNADALTTNTQTISLWYGSVRQQRGQPARRGQPSSGGRWGTSLVIKRDRRNMLSVLQLGSPGQHHPEGA